MKSPSLLGSRSAPRIDFGGAARRTVVAISALAGLYGILAERPIVTVATRAGTIAALGLLAISVAERSIVRGRAKSVRGVQGGPR